MAPSGPDSGLPEVAGTTGNQYLSCPYLLVGAPSGLELSVPPMNRLVQNLSRPPRYPGGISRRRRWRGSELQRLFFALRYVECLRTSGMPPSVTRWFKGPTFELLTTTVTTTAASSVSSSRLEPLPWLGPKTPGNRPPPGSHLLRRWVEIPRGEKTDLRYSKDMSFALRVDQIHAVMGRLKNRIAR